MSGKKKSLPETDLLIAGKYFHFATCYNTKTCSKNSYDKNKNTATVTSNDCNALYTQLYNSVLYVLKKWNLHYHLLFSWTQRELMCGGGSIRVHWQNVNDDISSHFSVNTSVWSTLDTSVSLQMRYSSHTYNPSTNHYRPNEQHQTLTWGVLPFPRQPGWRKKSNPSIISTSFSFACCMFHAPKLDTIKDLHSLRTCCHWLTLGQDEDTASFIYILYCTDHTVLN